jgi:acetyl-CoA carboxylase carboxyltransferase component
METRLAAAYETAGPGLEPGWLDAIIDPLETRTWISMGIEAASQAPATREFNMGVLQT